MSGFGGGFMGREVEKILFDFPVWEGRTGFRDFWEWDIDWIADFGYCWIEEFFFWCPTPTLHTLYYIYGPFSPINYRKFPPLSYNFLPIDPIFRFFLLFFFLSYLFLFDF